MTTLDAVKTAALAMQRHNWEQGTLAQAFLESGDEEIAILMAMEGAHRQREDGRCAQIGPAGACTDPCAIGEALIYACEKTKEPDLLKAKDKLFDWALTKATRNADGVVYHLDSRPEFWVDSFYMLPPMFARGGYWKEAVCQCNGYWEALFDKEKKLLYHRWDDEKKVYTRKVFWGVGNGWATAGMARVIALLPKEYEKERALLIERVQTILEAVLPLQEEDGLFHDILDDKNSFKEVNCGQMFAYTIYRGVAEGWLSESMLEAADRAREAAIAQVDAYGLVRNVAAIPHFDAPGTAAEGQAFFILMEAAYDKLQQKKAL